MKTFHIIVKGLVQGVNFRYYTKKKANELGISGYVKNLDDGSVEIMCTAKKIDLDKFIEWCKHGPEHAKVEYTEMKKINSDKKFNNFEIKY